MSQDRSKVILAVIAVIAICGFFLFMALIIVATRSSEDFGFKGLGGRLAQIDIKGEIIDSDDIVRQINKYRDDGTIKGLVLRIDSPGGGVAASQEIYDELLKFREDEKIVVVSMGAVAASGAYYISCSADSIIANPGTITGSIGVVLSYPIIQQLMDKVGLEMEVIKSGKLKDVGNYAREVTPEDRKMLQTLIDDTYGQFVNVVAESRGMDIDSVKKIADGSVFTGHQALDIGLVDRMGTLQDAIAMAGEMTDLGDNPRVVRERLVKRPFWAFIDNLLGIDTNSLFGHQRTWPALDYIYGH